jgi:hypothetical protein
MKLPTPAVRSGFTIPQFKKAFAAGALVFAGAAFSPAALGQTVLAKWTLETNTPADLTDSATISGIKADEGLFAASSLVGGVHGSAATDWSTPSGNGSVNSVSANTWAVGDYFQFQTSTTGFEDIVVTWDQVSSNTGPRDFDFLYSVDGTNFTLAMNNYVVLANASPNAWSATTAVTTTSYTLDLSAVNALENLSSVYFRIVDDSTVAANGTTVATAGTDRVDNFAVTSVPEPSVAASLVGSFGLLAARRRRR